MFVEDIYLEGYYVCQVAIVFRSDLQSVLRLLHPAFSDFPDIVSLQGYNESNKYFFVYKHERA